MTSTASRARHRFVLAAALTLLAMPARSRAEAPHGHDKWALGLAYGPASAQITGSDSLTTDWLNGPAQSMRFGRMLNPSLKLGFEHQAYLREQGFHDLKIRAGLQLEALGITGYPGRAGTAWSGLFVTGGLGWAHCRLTFLEPLAPGESPIGDTYESIFKQDEYGWGWFGGLGYELPISRNFTAGALLTYNRVNIDGSIFDHAQFVPLVANLNWSF